MIIDISELESDILGELFMNCNFDIYCNYCGNMAGFNDVNSTTCNQCFVEYETAINDLYNVRNVVKRHLKC